MSHQITTIDSPLGSIQLCIQADTLTQLTISPSSKGNSTASANHPIIVALQQYFTNPCYQFTLSLQPAGSEFQQRVWQALQNIPSGKTVTYGELAKQLKTSPRAIGQACRTNPIPIVIPCHRIVAATGLGGYSGEQEGDMINVKRWLLKHEGSFNYPSSRADMKRASG